MGGLGVVIIIWILPIVLFFTILYLVIKYAVRSAIIEARAFSDNGERESKR